MNELNEYLLCVRQITFVLWGNRQFRYEDPSDLPLKQYSLDEYRHKPIHPFINYWKIFIQRLSSAFR